MTLGVLLLSLLGCVLVTPEERHDQRCAASDLDGDGVCDIDDCAPYDPLRSPEMPERCNGVDDDCDEEADEGLFADADGDGWGVSADGACFASWTPRAGDCDDADPAVYPGAPDRCDGKRNDCDAPWALPLDAGLVTHVTDTGATDLTPENYHTVSDLDLPTTGTVYVCGSEEAPVRVTFRVGHVDDHLQIVGVSTGEGLATVNAGLERTVLRVEPNAGGRVTVRDLALTNGGRADGGKGGGIWVGEGTEFVLLDAEVTGNFGLFGGVWSQGFLEVIGSVIASNHTLDRDDQDEPTFYGGGLSSFGRTYVLDSVIADNYSKTWGGGVYVPSGDVVLNGAHVEGNFTDGPGAGIYAVGTVRLIGATVAGNVTGGDVHSGGGIEIGDGGDVFCEEASSIVGNKGGLGAGATVRSGGRLFAELCEVSGNTWSDGTPGDLWAADAPWSLAGEACFSCDGNTGCGASPCP